MFTFEATLSDGSDQPVRLSPRNTTAAQSGPAYYPYYYPLLRVLPLFRRRESEWPPVYVPLAPATQAEGLPGGRRLELPPVMVPPEMPGKKTTTSTRATRAAPLLAFPERTSP
jgi:hypothetical protein